MTVGGSISFWGYRISDIMHAYRFSGPAAPEKEVGISSRHQKVFVIHHGALGDLVVTFPLFKALKGAGLEIHLLCQGHLGILAQSLGLVQKAHALESAHFASLYKDAPNEKAKDALNVCDVMLAIIRSDTWVSDISRFFKKPIHRIPPQPEPTSRTHVSSHLLLSCEKTGLIKSFEYMPRKDPARILDLKTETKKIWIHPGAGSLKKRWPLSRFIETAVQLRAKGWDPAFLFGPAEFSLEPILKDAAPAFRIFQTGEVTELAKLLKTAWAFIGNDSGVSHLAAFLGLATLAIFGPTDPARWRPLGPSVAVVQGISDCSPCFESRSESCPRPLCLDRVTPQQVLKALFKIGSNG